MVNVIVFMGVLGEVDSNENKIRYAHVIQDFKDSQGKFEDLDVPLINWTKSSKGGIFSYDKGNIYLFKGRLDKLNNQLVILIEESSYLGKE